MLTAVKCHLSYIVSSGLYREEYSMVFYSDRICYQIYEWIGDLRHMNPCLKEEPYIMKGVPFHKKHIIMCGLKNIRHQVQHTINSHSNRNSFPKTKDEPRMDWMFSHDTQN